VFGRILVPLDGSRFGEHALPHALGLATRLDAALELVTVTQALGGAQRQAGVVTDESRERGRAEAEEYLTGVEERMRAAGFQGTINRTVMPAGNVANSLIRHLMDVKAGLTVMTTHGRGPLKRAWLGSTADGFIRSSPVPVLLLRPEEGEDEIDVITEAPGFQRILIPLDGSKAAERLLDRWRPLAGEGARVILFRALPTFSGGGSPYLPHVVRDEQEQKRARELGREYLEEQAQRVREEGVEVEVKVTPTQEPADAILKAVQEEEADLVAMSTEGRGGVSRLLLGSVADKVVRGSSVPVLLFREPEEAK
jgi:nucleotide-binding universal stress UspA family protein